MSNRKPVVALVGRPNVGKSTLFNRLTGHRTAIVEDMPGTTRDRIYGESDWNGIGFTVIDTGGLEAPVAPDKRARFRSRSKETDNDSAFFLENIQNQADVALSEADAIILVVDGMAGLTSADSEVAAVLQQSDKPVLVAVNKAESPERQLNAVEFWNLGIGEPVAISAYHGTGVGDLLDVLVEMLPAHPVRFEDEDEGTVKIALVGRPNVGKSSLLNRLIGSERAIVSDIPGTTRDPIDTRFTYNGQSMLLIDTAGIRRRGKVELGIERYSVLRSMRSIDRADVALLLIDATEGVTAQDAHVASYVLERHKGIIVLINKWDAIEKDTHTMVEYAREVRGELKFLSYVPVLFISALTGQRVNKILPKVMEVMEARRHRIGTGPLNTLLRQAYEKSMPPSKNGRRLRIYYGTQVATEPPSFALFVNEPKLVHFSYERFLENRLREFYAFEGTPIRLFFRESRGREDLNKPKR